MLNVSVFRATISRMGEDVAWYKAMPCDCYDPATNYDAQRSCDKCDHGFVYRNAGTVRALVANQKQWSMHPDLGWMMLSELAITVMPDECRLGAFDKVVLLQRTALARERVQRGADTFPHLMPVLVREVADGDTVYTPDVDYRVDLENRQVVWLTAGPTSVYAVEYEYRPEYWYTGSDMRSPRPALFAGQMTPIRGTLSLSRPEG